MLNSDLSWPHAAMNAEEWRTPAITGTAVVWAFSSTDYSQQSHIDCTDKRLSL